MNSFDKIRLVMIQFRLNNLELVPQVLIKKKDDKDFCMQVLVSGEKFLQPVKSVGCLAFLDDLEDTEYKLVDAFSEIRDTRGKEYGIVRFTFAKREYEQVSEDFQKVRVSNYQILHQMLEKSMWQVEAWLNYFFEKDKKEIIDDQYAVSINLNSPENLFDKNGKPTLRWQKDDKGERIGDAKIPLQPKIFLRLENGKLFIENY